MFETQIFFLFYLFVSLFSLSLFFSTTSMNLHPTNTPKLLEENLAGKQEGMSDAVTEIQRGSTHIGNVISLTREKPS